MHPHDRHAIALALASGAEVVVVEAVGHRGSAPVAVTQALAAGAARALRVVDPALEVANAPAAGFALATALDRVGVDLVLFGSDADPEGANDVPACIAHHMSAMLFEDVVRIISVVTAPAGQVDEVPGLEIVGRAGGSINRWQLPLNAVIGVNGEVDSIAPTSMDAAALPSPSLVEVVSLSDLTIEPGLMRGRPQHRGVMDSAPRPLVTLSAAGAVAALLRRSS